MDRGTVRKSLIGEECPDQTWTNGRYPDPSGGWNYGVGHHGNTAISHDSYEAIEPPPFEPAGNPILIPEGMESIGNDAANRILDDDIDTAIDDVIYWLGSESVWEDLTDVRRGALVQMAFQLGRPSLLGFTATRQKILDGDWEGAAREMLDSNWASDEQTPQRARRMATAFENNDASGWRQAYDPYDGG